MSKVKIVEVGLRDGLQNESSNVSVEHRYDLYEMLVDSGLQSIEIGAFVSPKWVPQMAVTAELSAMIASENNSKKRKSLSLPVLVPNEEGMHKAIAAGAKEVAIFAACSESFSKKNINCTIEESFKRFVPVMALAKKHKIKVRGYLSTCFACPYEGPIAEKKVVELASKLISLGCYEISIGDTIGVATPEQIQSLFSKLKKKIPVKKLAGHFHDTRGTALANIWSAYKLGVKVFDSSIGGLGGCPYAPGSAGNVATEDVVYLFENSGVKTGVSLDSLVKVHHWLRPLINHELLSKVGKVGALKPLGKL